MKGKKTGGKPKSGGGDDDGRGHGGAGGAKPKSTVLTGTPGEGGETVDFGFERTEALTGRRRKAEKAKLTGERARTLQQDVRAMPVYEQEQELEIDMAHAGLLDRTAAHADTSDMAIVAEGGVEALLERMYIDEQPLT